MLTACSLIVLLLKCYLLTVPSSNAIKCKNELGKSVAWYIAYKLPKEKSKPNQNGLNYAYITSKDYKRGKWILSTKLVSDLDSIWGQTLAPLHEDANSYTYFAWNDDPPKAKGNGYYAHSKGVIGMDSESGFWLTHSVPNFPNFFNETYDYPETGQDNAQLSLCLTFSTQSDGPKIGKALALMRSHLYAYNLIDSIPENNEHFREIAEPPTRRHGYFAKNTVLRTSIDDLPDDIQLKIFSKPPKVLIEIYSDLIGPTLKSDLISQTWRRGAGGILASTCSGSSKYNTYNVQTISMSFGDDRSAGDETDDWEFTSDHSKWAITVDKDDVDGGDSDSTGNHWVCIGDINRMESQSRRGGLVVCMNNESVWSAFKQIIKSIEPCNKSNRPNKTNEHKLNLT